MHGVGKGLAGMGSDPNDEGGGGDPRELGDHRDNLTSQGPGR